MVRLQSTHFLFAAKCNSQANVAILQPLTDLWLKMGPQRDPFPQKWYPEYQNNLWEAIHQNGGGCDYVSENIINGSTFKDGKMIFNGRMYDSLLLPEIETLDLETAKSLSSFADAGGKIVFIGKKPFKSPSYKNPQENDKSIKKIVDDLVNRTNRNSIIYPSPKGNLIEWYGKLQNEIGIKPFIKFDKTYKNLNQSCYQLGESLLCLVANTSLSEHISVTADFQVDSKLYPWIWNPETGKKFRFPTNGGNNKLELEIPRATSMLIVFDKNAEGEKYNPIKFNAKGKEVTGSWQLQLNHINGDKQQIKMETLSDLIEDPRTKNFAGTVFYEKTIDIDNNEIQFIDLGNVQGISELTLNGKNLGLKWYGAHIYDIKDVVKTGENKVAVKLTTITGNYMKGLTDNPVAQNWTNYQEYYPMGIIGPVRIF